MPAETHAEKLTRIEQKVDKITDAVNELSTATAVIATKVDDLEVRREESHQRANKFSERMDHMHSGIHKLDSHVTGLEGKVALTTKLIFGVGSVLMVAIINSLLDIV